MAVEQTLVIIKPDGVERKIAGRVIQRFEDRGFIIREMKMAKMTERLAKEHYAHLNGRRFFDELINYMTSGPVIYMVIEGKKAIPIVRMMVGKTKPSEAMPGTIRGDFGLSGTRNVIHASDSDYAAKIEIERFFGENRAEVEQPLRAEI